MHIPPENISLPSFQIFDDACMYGAVLDRSEITTPPPLFRKSIFTAEHIRFNFKLLSMFTQIDMPVI